MAADGVTARGAYGRAAYVFAAIPQAMSGPCFRRNGETADRGDRSPGTEVATRSTEATAPLWSPHTPQGGSHDEARRPAMGLPGTSLSPDMTAAAMP